MQQQVKPKDELVDVIRGLRIEKMKNRIKFEKPLVINVKSFLVTYLTVPAQSVDRLVPFRLSCLKLQQFRACDFFPTFPKISLRDMHARDILNSEWPRLNPVAVSDSQI